MRVTNEGAAALAALVATTTLACGAAPEPPPLDAAAPPDMLEAIVYEMPKTPVVASPSPTEERAAADAAMPPYRGASPAPTASPVPLAKDKGLCPIDVQSATAHAAIDRGHVLLLVTVPDEPQARELEKRARDWAVRTRRFVPAIPTELGAGAPRRPIQVRIVVQHIVHGAMIALTPLDAARAGELFEFVRNEAEHLGKGRCPVAAPTTRR